MQTAVATFDTVEQADRAALYSQLSAEERPPVPAGRGRRVGSVFLEGTGGRY